MNRAVLSALLLTLMLTACGGVGLPVTNPNVRVLQREPGILVTVPADLVFPPAQDTPTDSSSVGVTTEPSALPLTERSVLGDAPGPILFDPSAAPVPMGDVTAQAVKVVRTEWRTSSSFTRRIADAPQQRRIGPQNITVTVAGEYNLSISAEGSVRVVKVTGNGSIRVSGGMTFSQTYHTCAYDRTVRVERYIRYEQYAVYSNDTSKKTGAYSNVRQPARPGDVQTDRVGNWSIC